MNRPRVMGLGAALLIASGSVAAQDMEEEPTAMGMAPSMAAMGGDMAPSMMATRMAPPEAAQARMQARAAAMAEEAEMATGMAAGMAPEEPPGQARAAEAQEAAAARAAARAAEPRTGPGDEAVASRRNARWNRLRGQIDVETPEGISPPVRAELRAHARRVAKLRRIAELATAAGDTDAVARAERLLERANERHERRIAQLADGGSLPAPAAEAADENAAEMAASPMTAMEASPMATMRPSPMAAMEASPMTNMASAMAPTAMEGE